MRIIILLLSLTTLYNSQVAQGLYMPKNIKKAYQKKTRSYDGIPGVNYWINKSNYNINVSLDPVSGIIDGNEIIKYSNNSSDSLQKIVLRLYMDLYKVGNQRNVIISSEDINQGVKLKRLVVEGKERNIISNDISRLGTNLIIPLDKLLKPTNSIDIEITWSYKIPQVSKIRTGVYDSTSYFVSLWYPQIAVYDDIDGWDLFNYTGLQEFYNDNSNFQVNITVPKEYVVWATGKQTNISETFTKQIIKRINEVSVLSDVNNIISHENRQRKNVTLNRTNTWSFIAKDVPDFAFAVSNTYLWDLKKIKLENNESRKTVFVGAAYNRNSKDFYEVVNIACQSIEMMSSHLPGVLFPYNNVTVYNSDGTSGMEFPMILNDGSFENRSRTAGITAHELIHQYFPFYVGTNERKYAWMDEGWARMMQFDIQYHIEPSMNKHESIVRKYSSVGGEEFDVPLIVPSVNFESLLPYKTHAYTRPSMALKALQNYKGLEKFRLALKEYINRWKGKHPIPYDFFFTFNDVYNENLAWFWNPWFFEFSFPDLSIKKINYADNKTIIIIENIGGLPLPIELKVTYESGDIKILKENIGVWKEELKEFEIILSGIENISELKLGSSEIPDADKSNNIFIRSY